MLSNLTSLSKTSLCAGDDHRIFPCDTEYPRVGRSAIRGGTDIPYAFVNTKTLKPVHIISHRTMFLIPLSTTFKSHRSAKWWRHSLNTGEIIFKVYTTLNVRPKWLIIDARALVCGIISVVVRYQLADQPPAGKLSVLFLFCYKTIRVFLLKRPHSSNRFF